MSERRGFRSTLRFRDLTIGSVFEFASDVGAHGPWRKTSTRGYVAAFGNHRLAGHKLRVGSINAKVQYLAQMNPRRPRKRRKGVSDSTRRHYEFFRASSLAGMDKPSATAAEAKKLADAIAWAFTEGVDYKYAYGADAGYEDSGDEWMGAVRAIHPDGTTAESYGYLGNDYSQRHVEAEAALNLKKEMGE